MSEIKKNKAVASFEDKTGFLCVDIILLENSKFSFKAYRRDPEDNSGWFFVGDQSGGHLLLRMKQFKKQK